MTLVTGRCQSRSVLVWCQAAGTMTSVGMSSRELKAPKASSCPITSITCWHARGIAIFALSVTMQGFPTQLSQERGIGGLEREQRFGKH